METDEKSDTDSGMVTIILVNLKIKIFPKKHYDDFEKEPEIPRQ